jgi:hypothetical protein
MSVGLDTGARCDEHVGEVFPPRCPECEALQEPLPTPRYKTYVPGSECPLHRGYPMPCDRCERDRAEVRQGERL